MPSPMWQVVGEAGEGEERGSLERLASPVPPGAILTWDEAAGDFAWGRAVPYDEACRQAAQEESLLRAVREATRPATSPWMDAEQTAAYLGLTTDALYAQIARDAGFPRSRMGKRLLFNREEIDRHLLCPSTRKRRVRTVQPKVRAVTPTRGER